MVVGPPANTNWASPWHEILRGWNSKVKIKKKKKCSRTTLDIEDLGLSHASRQYGSWFLMLQFCPRNVHNPCKYDAATWFRLPIVHGTKTVIPCKSLRIVTQNNFGMYETKVKVKACRPERAPLRRKQTKKMQDFTRSINLQRENTKSCLDRIQGSDATASTIQVQPPSQV